jgi:hypothetical protein
MTTRAERLAADLGVERLAGAARVLADEAVLITGRLEQLDKVLSGDPDAWLGISMRMPAEVAEVTVNAPLAEARQQALALKGVLAELRAVQSGAPEVPAGNGKADELRQRRAEKRKQALEAQG